MKHRNRSDGFTLMELMIGLIIVGILATMALPGFSRAVERTRVKDAQTVLAAIYSSEKVYRLDQNSYGTLLQLVAERYVSDPDPTDSNPNWNFAAGGTGGGPPFNSFSATATRTGGGNNGQTVTVDQNFNGTGYGGTHPLRDL